MIKKLKRVIRRFIIKTVVDDYTNCGEVRNIVADGGTMRGFHHVPPPTPTAGQVPMSDFQ